jgi:hypothetical protein
MDRVESRRERKIDDHMKAHNLSVAKPTEADILRYFGDWEATSRPWMLVRRAAGIKYGLTDETGRPLTARARRILAKGHKVHARVRREELKYQKRQDALPPETANTSD